MRLCSTTGLHYNAIMQKKFKIAASAMQPSNNAAHYLSISTGRSQVSDTAAALMVFCALLKDTSVRMQLLRFVITQPAVRSNIVIHLEPYLWSPGCCKLNIPSLLALLKLLGL